MTRIRQIGIYALHSPDGIYIGQSRDIKERFRRHRKNPANPNLIQAIAIHGVDSLKVEVLHEMDCYSTQDHFDYAEQFYMAHYLQLGFNLLNIRDGGTKAACSDSTKEKLKIAITGKKHTPESIEKIAIHSRGSNNPRYGVTGSLNVLSFPVNQLSKNGDFINKWDSISDASTGTNIDHGDISRCCNGIRKSAGGFVWEFIK